MTKAEQSAYWRKWNRFQQKYERIYEKKFVKALQTQVDAFIKYQDINLVPMFPIYDTLVNLYKTVGPQWARVTRTESVKADGQLGFNERIIELMRQYYGVDLLNDAAGITEYTKEVIRKVLSQAAQLGWSFEQIVAELRTNSELSSMRARRIARTETVTSANGAAMIYAMTSGNKMEKIWIAVKDNRTRHDHRLADGKRQPIEVPFTLISPKYGNILMMQPGVRKQGADSSGEPVPAGEVVNCRCTVAFKAMRDQNGRIIRA
jgi:hypothetical protein